MRRSTAVVFAFLLFCTFSCSDSGDSGGSGNISDSSFAGATSDVQSVSDTFTPDSLAVEGLLNNRLSVSAQNGSDPCAPVGSDLWACQPILLRLYYNLAKTAVDQVISTMNEVGGVLSSLSDTSTPSTETFSEDGQSFSITYTKQGENLTLIASEAGGDPDFYLSVQDNSVTVRTLDEAGSGSGAHEVSVSYTDDNNWSATIFFLGESCDNSDFRAPERIKILVTKTNGVWVGKAMMYSPRWGVQQGDCSTPVTDDTAINFYTDFVGSDTAAKGAIYFISRTSSLPSTQTDFNNQFGVPNVCPNSPIGSCPGIINPFCNLATNLIPNWNDTCSSSDATVAGTDFSDLSNWANPMTFFMEEISIPSSL